ncbi:hypothetical protein lerEdw1_002006 [Lerista edwardsae]|nr:hypothetical protein lerEdw1_002006 [Lerista edwardsae]
MEHLDRSARFLRSWLVRTSMRQTMPWGILVAMLVGSLIKEFAPLPETYMSNKRNVLNVYFVKFAWAWTLCLLLPFISVTSYCVTRSVPAVLRRLSSLLVGTAICGDQVPDLFWGSSCVKVLFKVAISIKFWASHKTS